MKKFIVEELTVMEGEGESGFFFKATCMEFVRYTYRSYEVTQLHVIAT